MIKHNPQRLQQLQDKIGYRFKDISLLRKALTHSSFAYEVKDYELEDNERLEFLGDGILDFVIADALYKKISYKDEGFLSKTRAMIVCEATLSDIAAELELGSFLLFGKGEMATNGAVKASNLANAMEALFAAIYLDDGFDTARKVIINVMNKSINDALEGRLIYDYKSKLLEIVQTKEFSGQTLSFEIISEEGPVHNRVFTAQAILNEIVVGQGCGKSKKQAEQEAARDAIRNNGVVPHQ
ncbi:MAG: ribonuclease III [Clostridiaceae bacterium]|nr:ribonuclease III [Clostridiaceae bacterium]